MRNNLEHTFHFLFLPLLICLSLVSFGNDEKLLIDEKVENLVNTPLSSLNDSINDIIYNLYKFESGYGKNILISIDSILPDNAVEAKTIVKHYLYDFDNEHRYERLDSALKYAQKHNYDNYYLDYLITKGNLLYNDQAYDSAMVAVLEARNLVHKGDAGNEVEILHLLGDLFYALELYDNSEEYYKKANKIIEDPEKYGAWRVRVINNNLGLLNTEKGNYSEAIKAFENPINNLDQPLKNFNDSLLRCYINRKISYCLIQLDTNLNSALNMSRFSLSFSKKHGLNDHIIPSYLNIINLFLKTGQPDSLRFYLAEYSEHFPFEDLPIDYQQEDLLLRSQINEYLGNLEEALAYHKKYTALHRTTHLSEKAAGIVQMLTDQEYGKLESNYTLVNHQRNNLFIAIIIALILSAIILKITLKTHQLNKKLRQSNQTKDKLFSIISHDLRSPFHSIIGFNELIADAIKEKNYAEVEAYNKVVLESSHTLIKLTDNLLLWSKAQRNNLDLEPASIRVDELIHEAVTFAELQARKKSITINVNVAENLKCYVDRTTISIVLNNLISNALKFSYTGSEISIEAVQYNKFVDISIFDKGVGMPNEKLNDLFEVSKSKSTYGTEEEIGTGLGLVICKEFVEKNKGSIAVESTLKVGTTFTITLPKA